MSHQKMDQLVGFLLHPPLSEIAKKLGKMLTYTPTFKVLSAPLCIVYTEMGLQFYTLPVVIVSIHLAFYFKETQDVEN